ncbi:alpha/beta hydrolase family protein [Motilibacter peucedani]|nr:alpha/beta fold hydrolase [Motilibacter peucedani]
MRRTLAAVALCAAAALASGGCTSGSAPAASLSRPPAAATTTPAPAPSSSPTATAPASPAPRAALPAVNDPVSLPALMARRYDGRDLRLGRVLSRQSAYTRYAVTYLSGRLRISGVMDVPTGKGPFRTVVLAHGHIDLSIYTSGRGLAREQDYLARRGFVVLHTDYRNHASSSKDPDAERDLRLGYAVDVVNAVLALRASGLAAVDPDRIGLLGRSMGGGVVLDTIVAQPGLVDSAVLYDSVSSTTWQNFQRWTARSPDGDPVLAAHGTPQTDPRFWREVSPATYFDRVQVPVLVHHGEVDRTCPPQWSRDTVAGLRRAGADVQLFTYPGQDHAFYGESWTRSMQRTVAFFERTLHA